MNHELIRSSGPRLGGIQQPTRYENRTSAKIYRRCGEKVEKNRENDLSGGRRVCGGGNLDSTF